MRARRCGQTVRMKFRPVSVMLNNGAVHTTQRNATQRRSGGSKRWPHFTRRRAPGRAAPLAAARLSLPAPQHRLPPRPLPYSTLRSGHVAHAVNASSAATHQGWPCGRGARGATRPRGAASSPCWPCGKRPRRGGTGASASWLSSARCYLRSWGSGVERGRRAGTQESNARCLSVESCVSDSLHSICLGLMHTGAEDVWYYVIELAAGSRNVGRARGASPPARRRPRRCVRRSAALRRSTLGAQVMADSLCCHQRVAWLVRQVEAANPYNLTARSATAIQMLRRETPPPRALDRLGPSTVRTATTRTQTRPPPALRRAISARSLRHTNTNQLVATSDQLQYSAAVLPHYTQKRSQNAVCPPCARQHRGLRPSSRRPQRPLPGAGEPFDGCACTCFTN